MKRLFFSIMLVMGPILLCKAQTDENYKYQRGSLCMMMIDNPLKEYNKEIQEVFKEMPIPNRFNDHDLGVRVIRFANSDNQQRNITLFGEKQQLAKRMVSKWFDRNKQSGAFGTDLLRERGHYSATKIDVKLAMQQARGMAILEDMGENLISHTYWVVNDIQYVSQGNFFTSVAEGGVAVAGAVGTLRDITDLKHANSNHSQSFADDARASLGLLEKVKGFRVKVTSYLYRLKWTDEVADLFYTQYYTETPADEADKVAAFKADDALFALEYVGQVTNTSSKTSLGGVKSEQDMIRKVCTRALDKNIADLQHEFADFRIKAPLVSTAPLKAYVGLKEDITDKSRYEVLQAEQDDRGVTVFKRVGVVKPVKGKIWDNRFMADEEGSAESSLGATLFEKVSGGDFQPGMLIREMK